MARYIISLYALFSYCIFSPALVHEEQRYVVLSLFFGLPLSVLTAVYTAYLFAQATARDLWQNPLLPSHLFIQALLAGSAALLLGVMWVEPTSGSALAWILGIASLLHLLDGPE